MEEALEYWADKVKMPAKEFYALAEAYRARAFTVSGVAMGDMMDRIFQSIEQALAEGTAYEAWASSMSDVWEAKGWTGYSAWRVDNIFRTNVQTAYSVGRYKQMDRVKEGRPYWQYSAVNDSRTRPTHLALHGRVYRADSPFWDSFYPPNGFRCRCTVKSLSDRQVKKRELEVQEWDGVGELIEPVDPVTGATLPARPLMPDKGFEGNPGKEYWKPDLSKYPDRLRQAVEAKISKQEGSK